MENEDNTEELEWLLEAPEILAIPHADSPNVIGNVRHCFHFRMEIAVRALPTAICKLLKPEIFKKGASILCLVSSLQPDQMLKRDILPRKRTRSRIARLLALIGDAPERSRNFSRFLNSILDSRWAHTSELAGLKQMNSCSSPRLASIRSHEIAKPVAEKYEIHPLAAMTEVIPFVQKVLSILLQFLKGI